MKMFQKIQELIDDKDALVCVLIDEVGKTPWTVQFLSFVVRSVFWPDKGISWAIVFCINAQWPTNSVANTVSSLIIALIWFGTIQ